MILQLLLFQLTSFNDTLSRCALLKLKILNEIPQIHQAVPHLCKAIVLLTRRTVPALSLPERYFGVLVAKPAIDFDRKVRPGKDSKMLNTQHLRIHISNMLEVFYKLNFYQRKFYYKLIPYCFLIVTKQQHYRVDICSSQY